MVVEVLQNLVLKALTRGLQKVAFQRISFIDFHTCEAMVDLRMQIFLSSMEPRLVNPA